jgi:hypothetical protein
MIQRLKSGDALSKELMNGLIAKANGLDAPSDSFVNTSNGPLLVDNKI